jgi:type II secretory pathway predicted ATPase ExeA
MSANQETTTTADELCGIARQIRDWQIARNMTDTRLCADHDIGSPKTFRALADGNPGEYDADRWLPKYRAAWNLIQTASEGPDRLQVFDDIGPAIRLRAAFADAMRETGSDRLIIVEGNPGDGKTTAVTALVSRYGSRIIQAEAAETWRDSINAMLADLLLALGVQNPPVSAAGRLDKLIDTLRSRRVCLVIDEAHHMGPRGLNMVKTIINRTPGEIIMIGLPVLLKRLEMAAYQEARQLTLNRLCERITLQSADKEDTAILLERLGGLAVAVAREAAPRLAAMAVGHGSLKFVARVCRRILRDGIPTDAESVVKLAAKVAAGR